MYDLCITNGKIINADKSFEGNIYIKGGTIANITKPDIEVMESKRIINVQRKYIMPGFIDPHTHLNDPGLTESEDFYTGTCSAAAGGITTVLEHPLTFPLPSNCVNLENKKKIAESKAVVDFCLWGALTPNNYNEIDEMIDIGVIAFKAFMPYSVEIPQVNDGELLKHMKNLADKDILIGIHCENDSIVNKSTEEMIKQKKIKPINYSEGRPEIAEIEAVSRVAILAEESKAKVHVVHCSTSKSIDIISQYKRKGVNISVETCPHYLKLCKTDVEALGVYGICNPPLRKKENVEELKNQIVDGCIDFVGSDHATYTFEEKEAGKNNVFDTPAGLTGIQTCFPILFDETVNKKDLRLEEFVKLSSTNVAKRFNIYPQKGAIEVGADADFVIFDSEKLWKVEEDILFYKMKWSPYMNETIKGKVDMTIVRGRVVFENNNIYVKPGYGKFLRPRKG